MTDETQEPKDPINEMRDEIIAVIDRYKECRMSSIIGMLDILKWDLIEKLPRE